MVDEAGPGSGVAGPAREVQHLLPGDGDGGEASRAGQRAGRKHLWRPGPAGHDGDAAPELPPLAAHRHPAPGARHQSGRTLPEQHAGAVVGGSRVEGGQRPVGVDASGVALVEEDAVEAHTGPAFGAVPGLAQLGLDRAHLQGRRDGPHRALLAVVEPARRRQQAHAGVVLQFAPER